MTTTDRAEWERILANVTPQNGVVVSCDFEWFRGGNGVVYQWRAS